MQKSVEEKVINGLASSEGIAIGPVWVIDNAKQPISAKKIRPIQVRTHLKRFVKAKELFLDELEVLSLNLDSATKEIFEAQKHIVADVDIESRVNQLIEHDRFSIDYAIYSTFDQFIERLKESGSELFKQRIIDLENLRDRLIELSNNNGKQYKVPKGSVLIVKEISPTDLVAYYDQGISALVMDKGGVTSHATIIAQSLNIPCVVSAKTAVISAKNAEKVIVDSNEGVIVFNPKSATLTSYKTKIKEFNRVQKESLKLKEQSITNDGFTFHLRANVEFVQELDQVKKSGAEGIGLLRTEALLYGGIQKRSYEEQVKFYTQILEQSSGVCTIRLFDVGGDKLKIKPGDEDNPFLGWRGIRMLLDEREMLEDQLMAILAVSGKYLGRIQILVPMVTDIFEIREVKAILALVQNRLDQQGITYDSYIRIGIMVEVPSVALLASHFAKEIDFFSIGTNDLTQYALAVDRGNERICSLYQHKHPAVWQLIYQTVYASQKNNIHLSVCGELAGDPIGAATLIGMGVNDLSMAPHNIPKVKHLLSTNSQQKFKELAQKVMNSSSVAEVNSTFKALFSE
jgi:phosphotransferase system enzyme I (PtsI)